MKFTTIESSNDYGLNSVIGMPTTFTKSSLEIEGENNTVIFGKNFTGINCRIHIVGNDSTIIFGKNCHVLGTLFCSDKGSITIGNYFKSNSPDMFLRASYNTLISVGNECLFSNVVAETTDHHTIFDLDTKKPINLGANIIIGDRVWCARDVLLLKGTILGNDVVVGARSMVRKSINQNNVIIAGTPAKVIRENVVWVPHAEMADYDKVKRPVFVHGMS